MFEKGKIYKVKVEAAPGEVGFGRATIVERLGEKICIQLKTSRAANKQLSKGTRIWFVNDTAENIFNGMWASTVIGAQIVAGKTSMVCSAPRLEAFLQRRRTPRAVIDAPAVIELEGDKEWQLRSQDISSSGIALVTGGVVPEKVEVGQNITFTLKAATGDITAVARVIRIDSNWLANKTIIGLEYLEMDDESSEALNNLLNLLGLTSGATDPGSDPGQTKLFGWKGERRGEREDKTLVKGQTTEGLRNAENSELD